MTQDSQQRPPPKRHSQRRRFSLFPKPLASGLMTPVSKVLHKRGFEHEAILHYWQQAAGDKLGSHTQPVALKQADSAEHSQLIVRTHPAFAAILSHESEMILQRLTRYLGYRPAARIRVVQ